MQQAHKKPFQTICVFKHNSHHSLFYYSYNGILTYCTEVILQVSSNACIQRQLAWQETRVQTSNFIQANNAIQVHIRQIEASLATCMSSIPYLWVLHRLSIGRGGVQGKKVHRKKKIKQTTDVWRGKEDLYFKKVEKFELNMTGLHFVHACATSFATKQNNSYQDSTKRHCTASVFMKI